MITYKLFIDPFDSNVSRIIKFDGNTSVNFSMEETNTDHQAYLKWLDAGGVVLAADAAAEEGNTEGTQ